MMSEVFWGGRMRGTEGATETLILRQSVSRGGGPKLNVTAGNPKPEPIYKTVGDHARGVTCSKLCEE